jgi:hypothetical protein
MTDWKLSVAHLLLVYGDDNLAHANKNTINSNTEYMLRQLVREQDLRFSHY